MGCAGTVQIVFLPSSINPVALRGFLPLGVPEYRAGVDGD